MDASPDELSELRLLPLKRESKKEEQEHSDNCYMCMVDAIMVNQEPTDQDKARKAFHDELRQLCNCSSNFEARCLRIHILHKDVIQPQEQAWNNEFVGGGIQYSYNPTEKQWMHEQLSRPWSLRSIKYHVRTRPANLVRHEAMAEISRLEDIISVQQESMVKSNGDLDGDASDRIVKLMETKRKFLELLDRTNKRK